jgi:hypothetical protein
MVADGMLTRKRYREVPPRVDYELTERARDLMPVLAELARWGYRWAWSAPRASERVDIGAIFRLAPGLVAPAATQGEVELTVTDGNRDGSTTTYTVSIRDDRVELAEEPSQTATARVQGDLTAWVAAFAPDPDRSRLTVDGDPSAAAIVLDALATGTAPAAAAERDEGEGGRTRAVA